MGQDERKVDDGLLLNKVQNMVTTPSKVDTVLVMMSRTKLMIVRDMKSTIDKLRNNEKILAELREWQPNGTIKTWIEYISTPKNL